MFKSYKNQDELFNSLTTSPSSNYRQDDNIISQNTEIIEPTSLNILNPKSQHFAVERPIGQFYEPYGGVKKIDESLEVDDLYNIPEARAQAQSGWNLAGKFVGQLASEAVLGIPEAIGYALDFEELFDADKQAQEGFDNAFSRSFREAKNQIQDEYFPIYRSERSFSDSLWERLGDPTWIASQGKTLGTTMSLMLPSLAVAYATGGVGLGAMAPIAAAMFSRKAESAMEAVGTFETEYQQYLNEGKSDKEARELAGQTAAGIFKANAAMLPVDMMQYALGMKAFSGIKSAITIPGKTIAGKAANFGLQMGSEALEEGYQSIAAEEHIKAVRENIDPFGIGFTERLGDYIKDPDIQEAALLGALSGGVFEGGSTIANKAYKKYQEYATGKTLAAQFNDQESFNKIDNKIEADLIARAAKHDKFDTYIKTATAYNDKIQADENITPEEKKQVADKTNKIIENATFVQQAKQDIQKINEDYKETPELATQYALNKFQDKVISDEIVALSEQKKDFYNNLKDPKDKAFINNLEITALERQNKNLKKDNKLSDVYKEILIKDNEAKITKFKENLELLNDKIKETEPSFDVNEYSAPSSLLGEFLQTTLRQAALENKKTFLSKELSKAEKKSAEQLKAEEQEIKQNKEKEVKKAAKQDIENAVNNVTADNIEEVEKTVNDSDILNDTEKEVYRNKLSAVKNKLKVQSEINPETTTDWNNLINNAVNEKELDAIVDQMDKANVPIDFSAVNIKRQQLVSATPPKATEEGISSDITDINMFKSKPVETAKKILETNEADPQNEEEYTKQERESNDKDEKFLVPVAKEVSIAYRSKVGDEVPVAGGGKRIKDAFNEEGKVILEEGFNHKLLEPDYATVNTEIFLSIDTAHEDYNSTKNDINNVPIVIKNSEGEVLGYVHQLNWFDKQTLSEELMVKLKDETLAIRKQLTSPNIVVKSKIKYKAPGWLNQNFNKPLTLAEAFKKDNQYDDRVSFRILNKSQKLSFQGNIANPSLTNNLKLVGVPVQLIPSANGTFIAKRMKQVKLSDSNFADEVMHNVVGILLHVAKNKNVSQKVLTEEVNKYLYSTSFGKELADNFTSGLFKNNKLLFNLDLFTAGERSIVVSITSPRNMNRFIRYRVKDNNIIEEIDIKGNIVSQITPLQFETILKQSLGEKYINLTEQGFLNPQKFSRKVADENYKLTDKVEDYRDYLSENNIVNTFVHGVTTKEGTITYVTQPTIEIDTNVTTEDLSMTEGTVDPKPEVPVEKSDIEAKKADIEKNEIESTIVDRGKFKGKTRRVFEEKSIEEVEGDKIVVTKYSAKIGDRDVSLGGRTMTIKEFREEFPITDEMNTDEENFFDAWEDDDKITIFKIKEAPDGSRFDSVAEIKIGADKLTIPIKKNNAKYDAELAALNNQSTSEQKQQQKADIERRRQELESLREIETLYDLRNPIAEDSKEIISKIEEANKLRKDAQEKSEQAAKETNEEKRIALYSEADRLYKKTDILDKEVKKSRDIVINNTPIKQAIKSTWSIGQKLLNKIKLAAKSNEWVSSMPISKEEFTKLEDAIKRLSVKNIGEVTSNSEVIPDILLIEEINAKYDAELAEIEQASQPTPTRTNKLLGAINTATIETLESEQVEDVADLLPINIDYSTTSVMSFSKLPNVVQENDVVSSLTNFYIQNLNENKGNEQLAYQQLLDDLKGVKEQAESNLLGGTKTANKQIAKLMNTVLDNFEEVKDDNGVTVFTGYKNRIELELNKLKFDYREEEYDGENSKESFDNDKNFKTDPEKSASARIKRVLNFIPLYEKGIQKFNVLGLPIYRDYYSTFNTIMEATADVPINEILPELDILAKENKYPETNVYRQVLNIINNDNDTLKNDFAKVFRKQRALLVKVLIYPNDKGLPNNNPYISNRSGSSGMLLDQWKESFKNKLIEDKKGNLRYDIAANKKLSTRFNNLKPSGNMAQYLTELSAIFTEAGLPVSVEALEKLHGTYLRKPNRLTLIDVRKVGANYDNAGFDQTIKVNFQYFFEEITKPFVLNDADGLKNDVFKNQANKISLLAKYENIVNPTNLSHSFKNGHGDTVYGFVNPHYLSSLISQIKGGDTSLYSDSFSNKSTWVSNADNINALQIEYIDSAVNGNNTSMDAVEFEDMSSLEREQTKTAFTLGKKAVTKGDVTVRYLTPTPSDKTTFPLITALKHQVTLNDLTADMRIDSNSKLADTLYDLMVQSELDRINETLVLFNNAKKTNDWTDLISGEHYSKINETIVPGSRAYFFLIPQLNETLKPFLEKQEPFNLSKEWVDITKNALVNRINELIDRKSTYWQEIGMFKRLDSSYMKEVYSLLSQQQIEGGLANQYAVTDYVVNSMMGYANSIMLLVGDPATFTKPEKSWDGTINTWQSMVDGTITNMFKRTAKDIAPGYEGLFEANEKNYNVLFIEEPKKNSSLIEDYKGVLSKQISKLTKIELADAQEWTTLEEHLRVMRATGIISTTQEKIMLENAQKGTLTDAQIGVILQPMKPVQVGRMNYGKNGKQFFVNYYIKTSSFPLIPQLTQGLEIDALRKYMEENSIDRLVPNTAVKNGFFNSVKIYENGKLLLDENNNLAPKGVHAGGVANNIHILDRSFFRIQQDIPYDPNKSKILEGSQLKKLKFGDLFEAYDFILNGESKKGYELKEMDDAIHIEIYKRQYESLMNKLKATQDKKGKYVLTDVAELKKLLVEEADARGFDYNDIMILDTLLSKNSFDNLPLFVHPALPKLEALLNSLISNNVLKTKFPGKSFVQGSSMGFDFEIEGTKDIIERVLNKTGVVLTNEFTGELSYKVKQNSKGEDYVEAQVMMPWYFKESITPFINKVSGILDTSKIDPKLLEAIGYRIPTQDHGSMVKLKVVGFLPKSSGDLIIVPPEMSKLMGSDFDVDKLYIHWYNYKQTKEGNLKYVSTEASLESYSKFKSIESFVKIYEDYNPKIEEAKLKIERSWTKQSSMLDSLLNKKELQEKDLEDLFHLKKETELTRSFVNNDLKEATYILRQLEEGFEENFEETALLAEIIGFSGDEFSILNQADSEVQQLTQELFQIDAEIDQISAKISTISESKFRKKDVEDRVDKRHKKSIELSNNFWKLVAEKDNKIKNIIDSFSKSYEEASEYERLSTKQLQNLSLEITHSILENTEISKRVLTPLDNNDIKDVLKNISEIKTSEEIDESKASQSALVYDGLHSAFVDINAAGQYGIGVGSVASTSHILSQYAGLYLRKYKVKKRTINESILFTDKKGGLPFTDNTSGQQVKQDGVKTHNYPDAASEGLYRLDRIFGITGKRISQVVKNIQTESVDNAKNQRLFGMNLNKHTFGVGLFLAKTGLDENYIGNFLNQPIIIDYVKELNKLSDVGSGDFLNIKQKKEEIQKQLATKYGTTALEIKPKLISLEEMQENLSKTDQKFQVTVLESFVSYDNIGTSLASLFRSINVDTKYLDKNITSSVKRLDDFNSQFYPVNTDSQRIGNIDNLRSTLQFKAVEYGLQNSLELFERLFPYKSNFFQTVVESFRANNKLEELTENQIESLSKGLKNAMWVDAIINTYSLDELAERQKLLFGDNSLGNRVNKAKEKIDNLLIKLLVVNTDAKGAHTIEFPTAGTLEKDFNLKMQQSWLSLYKTHKRIAVDLVKYVLLNGNERNARDFSRFIPIDILKMDGIIDNITNSYNEILSNTNKVDTYLKQYFQHNPSKSFKGDIKDFTFYDENGKKVSEYYKAVYLRPKDETSNIKYADVDFVNIYLEGSKLLKRSTQGYVKIYTLGNSKKMITEYNISNEEKQSIFDATVETVQPLATNTAKIPEQVVSNANDGAAVLNKFGFTPGNTVLDVLNYIIKRGSNSGQIELAKVLLEKAGRVNDINFIRDFPKDEKGSPRSVFGTMQGKNMYIPPVNMINIPKNNKWNFKEMSADELFGMVFLHELIHAFTADELRNNDKGIFATTMLKHYREYVNSPQKSGRFKNAEKSTVEFVAELFTNAEFQKELNSIKSGKTNLLAEIWETIVNFVAGNINKDNLLAAALHDALNLMDTVGEVKQPSFQESINNALETTEDIAKLLSFDSQQKEVSLSERKDMTNISTFTNYSGAALGGDTVWANIGKEFGLGKQVNYRPEDLQKLTKEQLLEVENAYQQAVKDLGRKPLAANTFAGGLVRRDYLQAKAADAVFAVSTIVEPGQKDPKGYVNKTNKSIVSGGTGYAVQMAINLGKPVYVFDQNKEEWYSYETGLQDPITGATFNDFIKWDTPTLTTKFAGIGTREINDAGKQAIREVYEKTTQQKELSLSKTKQDIINNLELYSQKIGDVTVSDIQNMNTEQIGELLKKICK